MYVDKESGIKVSINSNAMKSEEQRDELFKFMQDLTGYDNVAKPSIEECIQGWEEFHNLVDHLVTLHMELLDYHKNHPHPQAEIKMNLESLTWSEERDVKLLKDVLILDFKIK